MDRDVPSSGASFAVGLVSIKRRRWRRRRQRWWWSPGGLGGVREGFEGEGVLANGYRTRRRTMSSRAEQDHTWRYPQKTYPSFVKHVAQISKTQSSPVSLTFSSPLSLLSDTPPIHRTLLPPPVSSPHALRGRLAVACSGPIMEPHLQKQHRSRTLHEHHRR